MTNLMSARITTAPRLQAATPKALRPTPAGMLHDRFDVAPDGRLILVESTSLTSRDLTLVLNWAETLKGRTPVKEVP